MNPFAKLPPRAGNWPLAIAALVLLLAAGPSASRAQQAFPVVFHEGPDPARAAEARLDAFASLRGLDPGLADLAPMRHRLDAADWGFLASDCGDCGEGQLVPAGVSKDEDLLLDFAGVAERVAAFGEAPFAGGRAALGRDGILWWNKAIDAPDADAVRVRFDRLDLPPGTEILLFSPTGEAQGPYTAEDITRTGNLWTLAVPGGLSFLEVRFPADGPAPSMRLAEVALLVDPPLPDADGPGARNTSCSYPSCMFEYACMDPADFPNLLAISNATARIRFQKGGSWFLCSGGLLNDGRGLQNHLFVTAAHCLSTQASAESMEFRWRYRSETCLAGCLGTSAGILTTGGGDLLATSADTDFTMVALSNAPPSGSVFLGWDAQTNYATTPGISLYRVHHPGGNMQHATSYWTNTSNTSCTSRPRSRYIQVTRNLGFTSGGSSGSLLVNAQGQMVGQFYGGCGTAIQEPCDPNRIHVDGQFRLSYQLVTDWMSSADDPPKLHVFNKASGAWSEPSNWTPARSTALPTDILLFNGSGPSGQQVVVSGMPTQAIGSLRLLNGVSVVLDGGADPLSTLTIASPGLGLQVAAGSSLELRGSTGADLRIILEPDVLGGIEGDLVFAAQDNGANPRIVSRTEGGLAVHDGATAAVAPGAGVTTDSLSIARGGFGNADDGAVDGGVVFLEGSEWHQNGRKDGTRAGAQGAGPHGLSAPAQAARFERGSKYIIHRGAFASPREYPTIVFRDDIGVRNIGTGSVIDGDLRFEPVGPGASGVGALNINAIGNPALTIRGDVVIPAGSDVPALASTATPANPSRVFISGDVLVADPAKFPAGLNGRRWVFDGAEEQRADFGGPKTLHRLVVDNAAGVRFVHGITLTASLELAAGPAIMEDGALDLGSIGVATPVNGWIVGPVRRTLDPNATATTRFFHVGVADGKRNILVRPSAAGGAAGVLEASAHQGPYARSSLPGEPASVWWTLAPMGGLDTTGALFEASFEWEASDLPAGADADELSLARIHPGGIEVWGPGDLVVDQALGRTTVPDVADLEGDWVLFLQMDAGEPTWLMY